VTATTSTSTTLAGRLAEFVGNLHAVDIPVEARTVLRWHLVDSIGVAIAAANPVEPAQRALAAAATRWEGAEGPRVLGLGVRCRPEAAALLNGALMQALEMDDKHGPSLARPGSTVTPAVLAVAEARSLSLGEALTAIAAGYEAMIRLGFVAGERFLARGYHTSSLLGGFGSAAAVGQLVQLAPRAICDALGIAGTLASGIQESTRTGATSKILHGGWGAHAGIMATDLAACGITGPDSVFEGRMGFFETHLGPNPGDLEWDRATAELGQHWHLAETAIKPYPCCQLLHSFVEAGRLLRSDLAAADIAPSEIEAVVGMLAEPGLTLVTEPYDRKIAPEEAHEARFSLPYVVARTLLTGRIDLTSFYPDALAEPQVRALAARVRTSEDPNSDYPAHCPARLEVVARGQRFRRSVAFHPGCPEAPMSHEEILAKFVANTGWLLGDAAPDVGARLATAPDSTPVRELLALQGSPR
jgi:2-methylcitrate dehydratase PrpD